MTDTQKKKGVKKSNMVNAVVAGIAGAIAGGVAVATAVVMSDKKNQKKVKDAWAGAKEKVSEIAHDVKEKIGGKP